MNLDDNQSINFQDIFKALYNEKQKENDEKIIRQMVEDAIDIPCGLICWFDKNGDIQHIKVRKEIMGETFVLFLPCSLEEYLKRLYINEEFYSQGYLWY